MIVFAVPNTLSTSKTARVSGLAIYIARLRSQPGEEIVYTSAVGFISRTIEGQIAEMKALVMDSPRSRNPILHVVFSWPADEKPTEADCDAAVLLVLRELKIRRHQCIYSLHRDTDNYHLHVIINRVDPLTCRPTEIEHGFTVNALHGALALIEHTQGWRPQDDALYEVINGRACRRQTETDGPGLRLTSRARSFEAKTGLASAQRIAIERAGPVIARSNSWAELNTGLEKIGMRFEAVEKRGGKVWVGDVPVKACSIDRSARFDALERRLGSYVPAAIETQSAEPKRMSPVSPSFRVELDPVLVEFNMQSAAHAKDLRQKRERQRQRQRDDMAALKVRQKEERRVSMAVDWCGSAIKRSAFCGAVDEAHRQARSALSEVHRADRADMRLAAAPFPDFKTWSRLREAEAAEKRASATPPKSPPVALPKQKAHPVVHKHREPAQAKGAASLPSTSQQFSFAQPESKPTPETLANFYTQRLGRGR